MDMRSNHTELRLERPCGACVSQLTVEGDVTLPGSLRETTNILHADAMAVVEGAEAMQERVNVHGRVVFCVMYTQGSSGKAESIEATADFTHLCDMPGAAPRAEVFAAVQAEDVTASVLGGRMTMRASLRLCARAVATEAAEVIGSIAGDYVEQKSAQLQLRRTVARGHGDVLLREEFSLPPELHITETLGARAVSTFQDAAGGQGRIGLAGEVVIDAIHASDMPGKPIVTTRHTLPVSQSVEIAGDMGDKLDGRITVKDVAVASQDMGDGERALRAEVLLGLSGWADREETAAVLTDAYTTAGEDVRLERAPMQLRTGDRREHAAESGKASLLLPESALPVRTMLAAFATPVLTAFAQQGSRLVTEGTLHTTLIYMSDEGDAPVSARVDAPFRAAFAMCAAPEDILLLTAANVEATPVTSDRVELRYILHAQAEGIRTEQISLVTEATAVPAAAATEDIVLYFAQPGEAAWDIARRYRIPERELRALNPELTGEPQAGQGLVVWRRNIG